MTGRKSKREIEQALEELEPGSDPRPAGLISVLSTTANGGDVEAVGLERRLVRVGGELRRLTPNAFDHLVGGRSR